MADLRALIPNCTTAAPDKQTTALKVSGLHIPCSLCCLWHFFPKNLCCTDLVRGDETDPLSLRPMHRFLACMHGAATPRRGMRLVLPRRPQDLARHVLPLLSHLLKGDFHRAHLLLTATATHQSGTSPRLTVDLSNPVDHCVAYEKKRTSQEHRRRLVQ